MIYKITSPEETEALGRKLGDALIQHKIKRAFITLDGEMGVGKTVFTRGFASAFGITGVKSPTYTIVNEYRRGEHRIFHFDLYRIEDYLDLESIGFDDYVRSDGYSIAEWSVRVPEEIPEDVIRVNISRDEADTEARIIEIAGFEL
jgi:tRNA threonylcarbamoyladenosine biosynthesis protein TsaE